MASSIDKWLERQHALRRQPKRRAARGQDLEVGHAIEQLRDDGCDGREVLEVVEVQQRAGAVQVVGDRLDDGPAARLARADRAGDRARDELGIEDGGEPDEVHRPIECCARSHLERKPALSGSTWTGDRCEAHLRRLEDSLHASEGVRAPDEAMVQSRQARRRQGLERREILANARPEELKRLHCGRDVLQPVTAEGSKRRAGKGLCACHVARRSRDDDLLAVRRGAHSGGDDDIHSHVALRAELGLAGVDSDSQAVRLLVGPWLDRERPLDLGGRGDCVAGPREREEHTVAGPVDLDAVVVGGGLAHELAHASARGCVPLPEQVQQPRRSFDVGEEERHRPRRQRAARVVAPSHALSLGAERLGVHCPAVFDTLSDKLQATLGGLGRSGRLDEEAVSSAMREIRLALLEADVNLEVARDFTATVKERALGQDVLKSLTPGQQVVKIVHEELTALMGSGDSRLAFGKPPTVILLAGLQGSGKTTAAAKLALLVRKDGKRPGLVACDLQRPAAVDQLEQLGKQIQIPVYALDRGDPVKAAQLGLDAARKDGLEVVILDTAGRLHVDAELMDELERVAAETKPTNVLLVLDAMTGQEAVNVALAFQERVAFDGVVLTKLDGDARGGAALSVRAVTGRPVKLVSVGEKLDQLEYFHPDRMASRILGMGDVLTLIEKAEAAVELDEQAEMEKRIRAGEFTFDDFLASYRMIRRMGPLQGVLKMIPGMGKQLQGLDLDEKQLARVEAIVLSMTPQERRMPHVISTQRRRRIAAGSGTSLDEVNKLMAARKQMAKMMKQMGKGKMPTLPPGMPGGARR